MPRRLPALLLALLAGCQPAAHFSPPAREQPADDGGPVRPAGDKTAEEALDPDLAWQDDANAERGPDAPLVFVSEESDRAAWEKLPRFWNPPPSATPEGAAAFVGLHPLAALAAVRPGQPVLIKVPRGLPDPRPYLPPANPPTLAAWQLGRELFFAKSYLRSDQKQACADCHDGRSEFTDQRSHNGRHTPRLLNVVYNRRQFWDGRAERLEEVVQRTLEDERETERNDGRRHVWGGVVRRLRADGPLRARFVETFGVPPNQDNVGRALATYLRTLLSGDALYDRALAEQRRRGGKELEQADFAKALRDGDLEALERKEADRAEVLGGVYRGYRLFFDLDARRPISCLGCHGAPTFSDGDFHNLGVGFGFRGEQVEDPGRLASAPLGEKTRRLMGAFKTPSLRGLAPGGPYFHADDREERVKDLGRAIELHGQEAARWNRYLDPLLLDGGRQRPLGLDKDQVADLTLFLKALRGKVDPAVAKPPQ